jgi:hydrogenase expression/formation protein HypE
MSDEQLLLPVGKLNMGFLSSLIERYTWSDERIVVGAKVGEDAAVIDMGGHYLLAKTDPITFVSEDTGYYAVIINANDIACMGGLPKWFLATLLMPERKTTEETVEKLFDQISDTCKELNVTFCGGHTEVTNGIDRPIVVGQMLGEVEKENLVTSDGAKIGDHIVITKGIPIEAASIIAREKARELSDIYASEFVHRCKGFLRDPGISVVRDARIAVAAGGVHAMHDPTEGGLATGLHELAKASGVGVHIDLNRVHVLPEGKLLCDHFGLNPLGCIASGTLLIVAPAKSAEKIIDAFKSAGIAAADIGKIIPKHDGLTYESKGVIYELPVFSQDEIVKIFS